MAVSGRTSQEIRVSDVKRVIGQVLEPFAEVANVSTDERVTGEARVLDMRVTPHRKTAASFGVSVIEGEDEITVTMGRHSVLELWPYEESDALAKLAEICQAIVSGRICETLWLTKDGYVARSKASIELASKTLKVSHQSAAGRLARKRKQVITYMPYDDGAAL
jgi:hypothetical protein